jgi:hypothetical protein
LRYTYIDVSFYSTTANAASATENKTILELPKTAEINEKFSEVFEGKKKKKQ